MKTHRTTAQPVRMDVYRTAIPMRRFSHAAAVRDTAEAIVVRVTFADGGVGWGETLPRHYVTGETIDSVVEDLCGVIWPMWAGRDMATDGVPQPLAPALYEGRCINAAICAFDLACLRRFFENPADIPTDVLAELGGRAQVRREVVVTVSGVLGAARPRRVARRLRMMRWFGMAHFKLKLTDDEARDAANLQRVHRQLARELAAGNATLRVDANGAWSAEETPRRVAALKAWGVCAVEQPVFCSASELLKLAEKCPLPLIADESLRTEDDARTLLADPKRLWWNIRLSKNGGLIGAMRLGRMAAEEGVTFVLGCMVGESSILAAAQRRFLEISPGPRFVEGNYGKRLLKDDLARPSLKFGYGGKIKPIRRPGLGVTVDEEQLNKYGRLVATVKS